MRHLLLTSFICVVSSMTLADSSRPLLTLNEVAAPTFDEVNKTLVEYSHGQKISAKVLKINIEDSQEKIEAFKLLIANQKTINRTVDGKIVKIKVNELSECENQDVDCLATKIFDTDTYPFQLYAALKYRAYISVYLSGGVKLAVSEIQDILKALSIVPLNKLNQQTNQFRIYFRMLPGTFDCNVKKFQERIVDTGFNQINIYPYWRCKDSASRGNAIIHEIGHVVSNLNSVPSILELNRMDEFALGKTWTELSNWKLKGRYGYEKFDINSCFLSMYSKSGGPAEDFAETFMFYVLSPEYVEKKCPQKAEVFKRDIFNSL